MPTLREQMEQLVKDMKNESTERNRRVAELRDVAGSRVKVKLQLRTLHALLT
jgi:hypothetical protein